ncbi:hypothetical protein BH23PSE1_BH23PSE1_03610 [soil metagenome]
MRVTLVAMACAGSLVAALGASTETLRLSHNTSDTTTWQQGAERFAELVEEKTGGETSVRVFPNAQLSGGDQMRQAEMVGRGALDLVVTSAINVTPLAPEMAVFALPYLYASYAEVDATTTGEPAERIEAILAGHGIKVLAWGENGFREVTNNVRPIRAPSDLQGLRCASRGRCTST